MKIISALLFVLILFSCQKKPMNNTDFESKKNKLYFISEQGDSNRLKNNSFLEQHVNFYIDDSKVLNKIKNDYILNESKNSRHFDSDYKLFLAGEDSKTEYLGKLDILKGLFYNSEIYYDFNTEFSLLPEESFKPLEKSRINLKSLKNAKKILKIIEDNNGIISANPVSVNGIMSYNGMTILKAQKDYLGDTKINQKVIEKVKSDLKGLGEVFVSVSYCNDELNCTFYVYCEKIKPNEIPNEYQVVKRLSDSINESIIVHTISLNKLKKEMIKNDITMDLVN